MFILSRVYQNKAEKTCLAAVGELSKWQEEQFGVLRLQLLRGPIWTPGLEVHWLRAPPKGSSEGLLSPVGFSLK